MAGKRGNGEEKIYKRADGRYEARITLPDGRHNSVYAKTRRILLAVVLQLRYVTYSKV